jgi:hypothetical protein
MSAKPSGRPAAGSWPDEDKDLSHRETGMGHVVAIALACSTLLAGTTGVAVASTDTHNRTKEGNATDPVTHTPPQSSAQIAVDNGLLTVIGRNVPLATVLQEVARRSGVGIVGMPSLTETVSANFQRVPIEEGLRRLLVGQNAIFVYEQRTGTTSSGSALVGVTILPTGVERQPRQRDVEVDPGSDVTGGRGEDDEFGRLIAAAVGAFEPAVRQQAVVALGDQGRLEATEPLLGALKDDDPQVRASAVAALQQLLASSGSEALPSSKLAEIATGDANTEVRIAALEVLRLIVLEWNDSRAETGLKQALQDADLVVRATAEQFLDQLKGQAVKASGGDEEVIEN